MFCTIFNFQTRSSENQTILRIVGERPPMENAVRVQPTLEDLYLFYFKGGCEE